VNGVPALLDLLQGALRGTEITGARL
jgi:hypothetical protein